MEHVSAGVIRMLEAAKVRTSEDPNISQARKATLLANFDRAIAEARQNGEKANRPATQ